MEQLYITDLKIQKVRHLHDIQIPLSGYGIKHLIFTGKNGSGKTSMVEALAAHINNVFTDRRFTYREEWAMNARGERDRTLQNGEAEGKILELDQEFHEQEERLEQSRNGLEVRFNQNTANIYGLRGKYHYILAYYRADRIFEAEQPKHVEKVRLKDDYGLNEFPRDEFVKYLLDLKVTESLARNNNKLEKADEIKAWFEQLEQLLRRIFADETVKMEFDEDTFEFHILQEGKEPFDFNTLSSGYEAVLDIVLDLIMRMENQTRRSFDFKVPGIVLIDEIETHLHLELQKNIMPLLTVLFPNIQFVVTTHSPFVLSSIKNVVIYDLENHLLVENGLDDIPYEGIVEGYFRVDKLNALQRCSIRDRVSEFQK